MIQESVAASLNGVAFRVYKSVEDGVPVIEIDTEKLEEDASGPICRIYLNDAVLHENPVYPAGEVVTVQWETLTFDEMVSRYAEIMGAVPDFIAGRLHTQAQTYEPAGWVLLRCVQMDSSGVGTATLVPFGPNNTYKEVPTGPVSPTGRASDMAVVEAVHFRVIDKKEEEDDRATSD